MLNAVTLAVHLGAATSKSAMRKLVYAQHHVDLAFRAGSDAIEERCLSMDNIVLYVIARDGLSSRQGMGSWLVSINFCVIAKSSHYAIS